MVEDIRRLIQAAEVLGFEEGGKKLTEVVEDLRGGGKLPDKIDGVTIRISKALIPPVEKTPEILTPELAEKVRAVTGRLDDDYEIFNLIGPSAPYTLRRVRIHTQRQDLEITPPNGWKELLQSLTKHERVKLANAINAPIREGFYVAGAIRGVSIEDLTSKKGIGLLTARFVKAIFEPVDPQ